MMSSEQISDQQHVANGHSHVQPNYGDVNGNDDYLENGDDDDNDNEDDDDDDHEHQQQQQQMDEDAEDEDEAEEEDECLASSNVLYKGWLLSCAHHPTLLSFLFDHSLLANLIQRLVLLLV